MKNTVKMNLQMFATPANMTQRSSFIKAAEIDFVTSFSKDMSTLRNLLGITRMMPMAEGQLIKTYKTTVTLANGSVDEGDIIPLSTVKREADKTYELTYKKYRDQVTVEAVQRSGFQHAVNQTDEDLLEKIQENITSGLLGFMATGTGTATGAGFQAAIAQGVGRLKMIWKGKATGTPVFFVNPMDVAKYLGTAALTTQNAFGLTFVRDFMGVTLVEMPDVPEGTYYATMSKNIVHAYPVVNSGEIAKMGFGFRTDETGVIGIAHNIVHNNLTSESVILTGSVIFAEMLDGVVKGTITAII